MLGFFMLEKMVLWRHDHDHAGAAEVASEHSAHAVSESHHHGAGRLSTAWMIIIGGAFHNFTDGLAIAAAFLVDVKLGVVTAIAIIAHELPQELGDFLVLIHSGFSRVRALVWNLVSSLATLLGATLAYAAIRHLQQYATIFLCLAAASMIYVAAADLIPGLHRRTSVRDSLMQIVLVGLGVGSIGLVRHLLGD
jgi:zinc and cadmium transporter